MFGAFGKALCCSFKTWLAVTDSTSPSEPKIVFPCRYPVKIVGSNTIDFVARVTAIVREFDAQLTEDDVSVRLSSGNKFCSVTCVIVATGEPQLKALHEKLRTVNEVSLVL